MPGPTRCCAQNSAARSAHIWTSRVIFLIQVLPHWKGWCNNPVMLSLRCLRLIHVFAEASLRQMGDMSGASLSISKVGLPLEVSDATSAAF